MSLFENVTRARLKDYFIDDNNIMTFVVEEVLLGKAIGKQAANVKRLEQMLNRHIRIIGFSQDPARFTKNLIYPLEGDVELQGNIIIIKGRDQGTRAFLIGREQRNLKNNLKIIQKYFGEIENLKVK